MQIETRTDIGIQGSELNLAEIKALCTAAPPCLTISMPVLGSPDQARQNPVRLRNLLNHARETLEGMKVNEGQIQTMLNAITLNGEELRAPEGRRGLLIFRNASDVYRYMFVTEELQESAHVGDHFILKPLLPSLKGDRSFYILALSQKHIRLLRCTDHSSEEVALPPSMPKSLEEATQSDKPDHVLDNRSVAGQGNAKGVLFGTSTDTEAHAEYLRHFFKSVDEGVQEALRDSPAPVVIAGVEYELSLYHEVSTMKNLLEEGVKGSPDGLKGGEMHKRALQLVQPWFDGQATKALEMYERFTGLGKATANLKEVVQAAHDGRVMHLFVTETAERMGTFQERSHKVKVHAEKQPGDEDLVNLAMIQTLLHSGEVHGLTRNKMPHGTSIAAVLRY